MYVYINQLLRVHARLHGLKRGRKTADRIKATALIFDHGAVHIASVRAVLTDEAWTAAMLLSFSWFDSTSNSLSLTYPAVQPPRVQVACRVADPLVSNEGRNKQTMKKFVQLAS